MFLQAVHLLFVHYMLYVNKKKSQPSVWVIQYIQPSAYLVLCFSPIALIVFGV